MNTTVKDSVIPWSNPRSKGIGWSLNKYRRGMNMCGIVGYIGNRDAKEVLISGLSKLEYRGYDSSGISLVNNEGINTIKSQGRLKKLEEKLSLNKEIKASEGIGHTRWATHGAPSDINSHPHNSSNDRISVVHNGIIENYMELKEELLGKGYSFKSETDTEVLPNLIDMYYENDLLDAVIKATNRVRGSFALGVVSSEEKGKIIAVRKDSPLIIGLGKEEAFIASDVPAILNYTRDVIYLNDYDYVELTYKGIRVFNKDKEEVKKEVTKITWSSESAEKGGYDHFTLKEIFEQPKAIKDTMTSRISLGQRVKLDDIKITKEELENCNRLYIVACGTAYHSGLVGKMAIEKLAKIPVEVEVASEFRYSDPLVDENSIVIVISQSGETADTLAVLRDSKAKGARVIAITNVVGSSIAREANDVFYTWAGPEIGVASTKAYLTQLIANYSLALYFAEILGRSSKEEIEAIKEEMLKLPNKVERLLSNIDIIKSFAGEIHEVKDAYFLGRGLDYTTAVEGALKLKELTYIHAEAYKGGELKHGPIALIEKGTVVIAPMTQNSLMEKMQSNVKEVVTRGAKVFAITNEDNKEIDKYVDRALHIPNTLDILSPVLSIVPLQLLSYYVCSLKGLDIDKPRNLAKSVTVE